MAHVGIGITEGAGTEMHGTTRTLADATEVKTQHVVLSGADGSQSTRVVSVSTTRGELVTLLADRVALMLHNSGTTDVYLGGSDVTADDAATTGGWILEPGEKLALGFSAAITLYAIVASGSGTVRVWQVS